MIWRHVAALGGHIDVVKYLVKNVAEVDAVNEVGLDLHNIT